MRASEADLLIIPGFKGSERDHWQTRWAAKLPAARRVEQRDFERPVLAEWRERIVEAADLSSRPAILIAHSLGALAVAASAPFLQGKVKGAFLVAPPAQSVVAEMVAIEPAFAQFKALNLSFPALLIASRNDPYAPYPESERLAAALAADLVDAGASGHINVESGHGPWPEGLMRLAGFLKKL